VTEDGRRLRFRFSGLFKSRPAEAREGAPSHQSGVREIEMEVTLQINTEIGVESWLADHGRDGFDGHLDSSEYFRTMAHGKTAGHLAHMGKLLK
jgi:hypothetical protein